MKTVQRIVSVLLCGVLLAAFAPAVCAADTLIEEAFATYAVPAGGEAFDFDRITVPLGAHYTAEITSVYYTDAGKTVYIQSGDAVQAGVQYSVRIRFAVGEGFRFDDGTTAFTVNGEEKRAFVSDRETTLETTFVAEDAPENPGPTPDKPTFRERVRTFFRDMRNRILYAVYYIRYLFGIRT